MIVFGGNTQNPMDTDGDGNMGDPVEGLLSPEGNREGIFNLATNLYVTGWDVLAFGEEELVEGGAESSVAYQEVTNALDRRFVGTDFGGGFSIIGYSQGGGATHDLIAAIYARDEQADSITTFGVYLDAVDHNLPDPSAAPETRWPLAVFRLLNIYQTNNLPRGGEVVPDLEIAPATVENINVTETPSWDNSLGHQLIDDEVQVQRLIRARLQQYIANR